MLDSLACRQMKCTRRTCAFKGESSPGRADPLSLRLQSRLLSPTRLKTPDDSSSRLAQLLPVSLTISAIQWFTWATASSMVNDRFACAEA